MCINRPTRRPTVATERTRAHVLIPEDLLREVDQLVGPRRRSEFFVEAAREKVARLRLRQVANELAGSLADKETPGWESSEAAAAWVHDLRREGGEGSDTGNGA